MIKREYFYSGRIFKEGAWEFCGTHYRKSFFPDARKVFKEINEEVAKKGNVEEEKVFFDKFHRI